MADEDGVEEDASSFSHFLFSDDNKFGLMDPHFLDKKPPKMLSFGNFQSKLQDLQKPGISCSDSSSSGNECNISGLRLKAKRSGSGQDKRTSKKMKSDNPTLSSHAKRKEKLGERVATLQQLVSPFGKTDTSSVLHEAMGYIKFLHEQVQVLCCPYFQNLPFLPGNKVEKEEAKVKNLRSRGLCLVPVETTLNMANNNGADLWLPGMKKSFITKH